MALQAEKAAECPGCGHPLDETTDEDTDERDWHAEAVQCMACARRERFAARIAREDSNTSRSWLIRTWRKHRG